eukprot:gene402-755_t
MLDNNAKASFGKYYLFCSDILLYRRHGGMQATLMGAKVTAANFKNARVVNLDMTNVSDLSKAEDLKLAEVNPTGLNDLSKGIDRYGYTAYAKALFKMLHLTTPPICVGIYAKWGTGKSFMMNQLKSSFDNTCKELPGSLDLVQFFEDNYPDDDAEEHWAAKLLDIHPPYWVSTLLALLHQIMLAVRDTSWKWSSKLNYFQCLRSMYAKLESEISESEDIPETKEYVFVDFNAWEFASSDELWAGLIRNLYIKVELRIKAQDGKDYKRQWRVQRAITALRQTYGIGGLYLRVLTFLISTLGFALITLLEILGITQIVEHVLSAARTGAVAAAIGTVSLVVATLLPSIRLLINTNQESMISRGDAIFDQARSLKDELGFMSLVKKELNELFGYLREFSKETRKSLIMVLFVDDLDRCLQGRNVKVLEAMQLILAVPGAPIIAFLAIDSRIVVASIEQSFGDIMRDNYVSGWEYLDKIVQLPFSLPEPPPEKVRLLLSSSLQTRSISPEEVLNEVREITEGLSKQKLGHDELDCVLLRFPNRLGDERNGDGSTYLKLEHLLAFSKTINPISKDPPNEEDILKQISDLALLLTPATREARLSGKYLNKEEQLEKNCWNIQQDLMGMEILKLPPDADAFQEIISQNLKTSLLEQQKEESDGDNDTDIADDGTGQNDKSKDAPESKGIHETKYEKVDVVIRGNNVECEKIPSFLSQNSAHQKVSFEELEVFTYLARALETNPRRIKRIMNTYTLITEVANNKTVSDFDPRPISKLPAWATFRYKLIKWVCMVECYPYRMSLLVLLILDYDQRHATNTVVSTHPKKDLMFKFFCKGAKIPSETNDTEEEYLPVNRLPDNQLLSRIFYEHVERFLYVHKQADKMMRLDGDPDRFAMLISMPLPNEEMQYVEDLLVQDLLGPLLAMVNEAEASTYISSLERDSNLALLSYSYNLNPALRDTLNGEMSQRETSAQLMLRESIQLDGRTDTRTLLALNPAGTRRKMELRE